MMCITIIGVGDVRFLLEVDIASFANVELSCCLEEDDLVGE